ncbi:MAG: tripartite tricarboxylate transporter TctB family protein [Clostridia bacterium]|nr:tripartite tricarboxylate transporter TctB family protein [Clostridia bacterium]
MKIKYNKEIISGAIFTILGLVLWFLIPSQIPTRETKAINAQTMPRIAIGGMVIFAFCLLMEGLFMRPKQELVISRESFRSAGFKREMKSILYALFLVVFCFIIKPLGFVPSVVLLVIAILLYYGARKWYYYAIPLAMVGVVYYVFRVILHISLP